MIEQTLINIIFLLLGVIIARNTNNRPVEKQKDIKNVIHSLNPLEAYRTKQSTKELQLEADKLDTILKNIENYDGTGRRQEDVPKGE